MTDLAPAAAEEELQERVNGKLKRYRSAAQFTELMAMTPDRALPAEVHAQVVYETERNAVVADRHTLGLVSGFSFSLFSSIAVAALTETLTTSAAAFWLALAASFALTNLAFYKISRHFLPPRHSVSSVMAIAWAPARRVIEAANDENTVPALLERLESLEAEARAIYTTYGSIVSPVEREQVERDFLLVCALVELLGEDAAQARHKLYSTRRQQHLQAALESLEVR